MKYRCTLRMSEVGKGELSVYKDFFVFLDEDFDYTETNMRRLKAVFDFCGETLRVGDSE